MARSFGQSIVVAVDAPCSPSEIQGGGGGGAEAAAVPAAAAPAPAPAAAGQAAVSAAAALKPRPPGVVLRGSGGSGKRPAFKAPRPKLQAPAAAAAEPPTQQYAAAPVAAAAPQRRPFQAPARRPAAPELGASDMHQQPQVPHQPLPQQAPLLAGAGGGASGNQARSGELAAFPPRIASALHSLQCSAAQSPCNNCLLPPCLQEATS